MQVGSSPEKPAPSLWKYCRFTRLHMSDGSAEVRLFVSRFKDFRYGKQPIWSESSPVRPCSEKSSYMTYPLVSQVTPYQEQMDVSVFQLVVCCQPEPPFAV